MTVTKLSALVLLTLFNALSFGSSFHSPSDDSLKIIEKVYLHTDRITYYPGDDIWFKAYLIDASERLLSNYSRNLHVELISPSSGIINSHILNIVNGLANGDLHLSENLKSGEYRLRAYTNYMRNFGEELFFNKSIIIINPADSARALSNHKIDNTKLELTFYPEGGSLVENVTSLVAFKAEDANGMGCEVTGEIYSSSGELITSFKSIHDGMGTFSICPSSGITYYALAKNNHGEEVKTEFPKTFSTGLVVNIFKNQKHQLSIAFRTNNQTLPLILDHDLSLSVSARKNPLMSYSFRMKSLNCLFNLPTDDLPDGIVMLTLRGPDSIPLCQRLAYIQNNEAVKLNLKTSRVEFKQRDSVSVNISFSDSSGVSKEAFLSLSATDNIFNDNSSRYPSNISSWFLLESDVKGQVEDPSYYFDQSNSNRLKALDLLLLTQGWRDFQWKYKNIKYEPENGFTISGRARKKLTDVSLINSNVTISIFQVGNPLVRTVSTDSSGRFYLNGIDFNGRAKLIASISDDKDNLKGMLILDTVKYSPAIVNNTSVRMHSAKIDKPILFDNQLVEDVQFKKETIHTFIMYSEINNVIKRKYKLSDTVSIGEVNIIAEKKDDPQTAHLKSSRSFYLTPDVELIVTPQMQLYNNLHNLVQSEIPRTNPRNLGGAVSFFSNPLLLLDGMLVDPDIIFSMPISSIERIDVLGHQDEYAMFGSYGSVNGSKAPDGAINFITRVGAEPSVSLVYHSAGQSISGYDEPRIFYSPRHHQTLQKDYKPDLRTTLFWEPNIKIENNKDILLNYYNADNSAKIKITVEGITSTGIPVTGQTEYDIK